MYTYTPDRYSIAVVYPNPEIGLPPGLSSSTVDIKDWVSLSTSKPVKRFNFLQGVVSNEPFVDYIGNTARIFSLTLLQTSSQVEELRALVSQQEIGNLGFLFSIIDNGEDTNSDDRRPKSNYFCMIEDEPEESWAIDAGTYTFNIQAIYGVTTYQ